MVPLRRAARRARSGRARQHATRSRASAVGGSPQVSAGLALLGGVAEKPAIAETRRPIVARARRAPRAGVCRARIQRGGRRTARSCAHGAGRRIGAGRACTPPVFGPNGRRGTRRRRSPPGRRCAGRTSRQMSRPPRPPLLEEPDASQAQRRAHVVEANLRCTYQRTIGTESRRVTRSEPAIVSTSGPPSTHSDVPIFRLTKRRRFSARSRDPKNTLAPNKGVGGSGHRSVAEAVERSPKLVDHHWNLAPATIGDHAPR